MNGSKPGLLGYEDIPAWHQDNPHVLSGYRKETNSVTACLDSWTYIHNETSNIFSHLLPAVFCAIYEGYILTSFHGAYPAASQLDKYIFAFFTLTAASCLAISSAYHTLMNHSARVAALWHRIDYLGIILLTLGDFVSGIFVLFYRDKRSIGR